MTAQPRGAGAGAGSAIWLLLTGVFRRCALSGLGLGDRRFFVGCGGAAKGRIVVLQSTDDWFGGHHCSALGGGAQAFYLPTVLVH